MEFEICETDQFEERYKSVIPESLKKTATKKIDSLKENADKKGKPIRYPFFREIKLGKPTVDLNNGYLTLLYKEI